MKHPSLAGRLQGRFIGDQVYRDESDPKRTRRVFLFALAATTQLLHPFEITITENSVVCHLQGTRRHVEYELCNAGSVVGILENLKCERLVAPEIAQLAAKIAKIVPFLLLNSSGHVLV